MNNLEQTHIADSIQRIIARAVAKNPVGRNLLLIGGFRYRFLDESVRTSVDIDYHWSGDLEEKQRELLAFFNRAVLPEIRRKLHFDGHVSPAHGPDAESPAVRVVDAAFWREEIHSSRIEIPVELTRIPCADPVTVRTVGGTIYPTVSEGDMIESKVIAIFNRMELKHRDIVDLFLFHDRLPTDSRQRLDVKLRTLKIPLSAVEQKIADLRMHEAYHSKAVQAVIDTQLEPAAAAQINDAGGGKNILVQTLTGLGWLVPNGEDLK